MSTPDAMTLVIPLRAKEGMSLDDYYEYWLNAHVTLPARFPGIHSIWLHAVDFTKQTWPVVDGVSSRPEPAYEFHGIPEATFPTMEDLGAFVGASRVQMEDGINFLSQQLAYASLGASTATLVDKTEPAPDGHDGLVRHVLFLTRNNAVPVEDFRTYVSETLAPALAAVPSVLKVKRHLFEPLDVTLDHPGVLMTRPLSDQYQAAIEVVFGDAAALAAFAASALWTDLSAGIVANCVAVHAAPVFRCITTKHNGEITLAGVRGVAVADTIKRLGAKSQTEDDVSELFVNDLSALRPAAV